MARQFVKFRGPTETASVNRAAGMIVPETSGQHYVLSIWVVPQDNSLVPYCMGRGFFVVRRDSPETDPK